MEKIKVTFLGACGSVPKKNSNFASTVVSFNGHNILFDCPEGTQRQLMNSKISLMKIDNIFISHMHADHFLGLFGYIATLTLNEKSEPLTIYSPRGGKEKIKKMLREVVKPSFEIIYKESKKGKLLQNDLFSISAFSLDHDISCYGYVFKENDLEGRFDRKKAEKLGIPPGPLYSKLLEGKTITVNGKKFRKKDIFDYSKKRQGRKIVIVNDTRPVKDTIKFSKNADILIHESTFTESRKERAIETKHSTALEAATIAKKAKVKLLALFHFSASITDKKEVIDEAKKEFENVLAINDFDEIIL
jgi:ribonuclease Z